MKPIKTAAISGIIMGTIIIMSFFTGFIATLIIPTTMEILSTICGVLFLYGFFIISKKYKLNSLKILSIYLIIFTIISSIAFIYALFYLNSKLTVFVEETNNIKEKLQQLNKTYGGEENIPKEAIEKELQSEVDYIKNLLPKILKILILLWIGYFVFYGIPKILFGISLLKLDKKVNYAKATGILNIIGGAATIIFIGYLILIVAFIFEILLLFKEAEKEK